MTTHWELRVLIVTVPTPGTPVVGADVGFSGNDRYTPDGIIAALDTNTDKCAYGGSNFDANHKKTFLAPGQADSFKAPGGTGLVDLSKMRFDAIAPNDGFAVTYYIPA